MNADHDFQIGKDHTVCQDYAVSGAREDKAYAIVCDGCSASPDVDFGARVLALAAKELLIGDGFINYEPFGSASIMKAKKVAELYNYLHPQFLDATLLSMWVAEKKVRAYLYGDGVFVRRTSKGVHTLHIDFSNNAPAYLSYYLEDARYKRYLEAGGTKHIVENDHGVITERTVGPFDPVIIETPIETGDIVAVISDGINSFRCSNNDPIDWAILVDEFTGFKNTNGEFARRRLSAFKRKCLKDLTTHSDDISIATICV